MNKASYQTTLEKKIREVLTPFQEYINSQAIAGIFLVICTLIALVWASLPVISHTYNAFVKINIGLHFGGLIIEKSVRFWVNDVLLTLFFFFVGLEIKREFLVGELTNRRRAVLVLMAAVGGMLSPALIYFFTTFHTPYHAAWGIPMATDTAFALGVLTFFRDKLPKGVFVFLAALAIIDDIGAIVVIAIFYTSHLQIGLLFIALLLVFSLLFLNYAGFRRPFPYLFFGVLIWFFVESAGVHGTIAGIAVSFLIPARPQRKPKQFMRKLRELLNYFDRRQTQAHILEDQKQHAILEEVQTLARQTTTPLQSWESKLELPIALIVLPLFALANAGIPITFSLLGHVFSERLGLGIVLGLLVGKPLGVILFSRIAVLTGVGVLPQGVTFKHIFCVALLTGIGFTMSLFIANISFNVASSQLLTAKAAIIFSSLFAGVAGTIAVFWLNRQVVAP